MKTVSYASSMRAKIKRVQGEQKNKQERYSSLSMGETLKKNKKD